MNFVWFPKQYLLGFCILEKQLANIPDRGFLFLHNTLLLYCLSPYSRTERLTEKQNTRYAWAGGTFFPVVLLCQFSALAGNRFWVYILLMYLEYHTVVVLCDFYLIWQEIIFGMYVLSVQYSCAVVSVFLLWRESLYSMNFLVESENFLLVFLALYGSTTIQSRLFLKNIENFGWFPKQYLLGFFTLEKQFANILDRGFQFLCNTLLLYSFSPYWQTERLTETQIHSLRMGWRNFSPVVLLCQFFVLAGNRFWFYILLMYLEYHAFVVLC